MLVSIDNKALEDCKKEVKEFLGGENFHEVGGYLIGLYDIDTKIELFFLDKNAESTPTMIKLSNETFLEVENLLKKYPNYQYIGTWHVHPGKNIPHKSQIDESTLFLERLVLETDNPEKYTCPRIHIIFNEDFSSFKCYTMRVNLDYELIDVSSLSKSRLDINILDIIKNKLDDMEYSTNGIEIDDLEDIYNDLVDIRELIDNSLDSIESVMIFEEFKEIFYNNVNVIESIILSNIRNKINIGILGSNNIKETVIDLPYRPTSFTPQDLDIELFGFWKYFPYTRIDPAFENIFLANFFLKIESDFNNQYFYFRCNKELRIEPFMLKLHQFNGIEYTELDVNIIK